MTFLGALGHVSFIHLDAEARPLRDRDEPVGIVEHVLVGDVIEDVIALVVVDAEAWRSSWVSGPFGNHFQISDTRRASGRFRRLSALSHRRRKVALGKVEHPVRAGTRRLPVTHPERLDEFQVDGDRLVALVDGLV